MEKPPAFQFYATDFLGSADVQFMSDKAFRAYINLLAQGWLLECRLPKDDRQLAILARVTPFVWQNAKAAVLAKFEDRGDHFVNLKQEAEKQLRFLCPYLKN